MRLLLTHFPGTDVAQTAMWHLLHALDDGRERPVHFLDGVSWCGATLCGMLSEEFFGLLEEALHLLRDPQVRCCAHPMRCRHDLTRLRTNSFSLLLVLPQSSPALCQLILRLLQSPFRSKVSCFVSSRPFFLLFVVVMMMAAGLRRPRSCASLPGPARGHVLLSKALPSGPDVQPPDLPRHPIGARQGVCPRRLRSARG